MGTNSTMVDFVKVIDTKEGFTLISISDLQIQFVTFSN
jgi:hypothetical protein